MKKRITLFLIAAFLIQGCSSTDKKTIYTAPTKLSSKAQTPEELVQKATNSTFPKERSQLLLDAAKLFCEAQLLSQCNAALLDIQVNELSKHSHLLYQQLSLDLSIASGDYQRLIDTYESIPQRNLNYIQPSQQSELYQAISHAYQQLGQPISAALLLFENIGLFPESQHAAIHEEAWRTLRSTDTVELSKYLYVGDHAETLAWIDLARTIQLNQINLDSQYQAYQTWKTLWPDHPASLTPPKELVLLDALPTTAPSSVTLALPLTGPIADAGIAIRDGFMAAHYNLSDNSNPTELHIEFFDTNEHSILELYENDVNTGVIIGPLDKTSLSNLRTLDEINIPTLALNTLNDNQAIENLYQLGLAPEDEAKQIAHYIEKQNLRKVALILPENNLGFRVYDAFEKTFSQLNGLVIESAFYSQQATLAETVAQLLQTNVSKKRKQKIQAITGERFEFFPRRRKDLDAIFMVAKPDIAKQIKPLLAYNYAADLPVFSSSHIHQANSEDKNRDLDNIKFLDIPWMLSNTIEIKNQIAQTLPSSNKNYSRFHALGADAYAVVPRLQFLKEIQGSQLQGHTGTLQMTEDGTVNRHMQWAIFKRGKALTLRE